MIDSVECLVENNVDAVFAMLLAEQDVPLPVREFVFDEKRKFRFDYAWPEYAIAIEQQGGRWRHKGAHNTGGALARDYEKSNLAQVQGWVVLQVFPETLRTVETAKLVARAFALRNA